MLEGDPAGPVSAGPGDPCVIIGSTESAPLPAASLPRLKRRDTAGGGGQGEILRKLLHILVAEPPDTQSIRRQILSRRRVRLAGSEQECLDLAYAGSADAMIVDLDEKTFADPDFIRRLQCASRNAFPILGVVSRARAAGERWSRNGLAELLIREDLTPERLDRVLRHWIRYRRMQRRLCEAERRALGWWKNLVDALDEVRHRLEGCSDSMDAFLGLLEDGDGDVPELRRKNVACARQQIAELSQIIADLDVAARTIQLRGLERSEREARCRRPGIRPEAWLSEEEADGAGERSIDGPPHVRDSENPQRRFGT